MECFLRVPYPTSFFLCLQYCPVITLRYQVPATLNTLRGWHGPSQSKGNFLGHIVCKVLNAKKTFYAQKFVFWLKLCNSQMVGDWTLSNIKLIQDFPSWGSLVSLTLAESVPMFLRGSQAVSSSMLCLVEDTNRINEMIREAAGSVVGLTHDPRRSLEKRTS